MQILDLIILGAGPAGYLAAERAAQKNMNVMVVEKDKLGGVCLNEGCIPSKVLLHSARIHDEAACAGPFGVHIGNLSFHHKEVIERKNNVVKTLETGIASKMKKNNIPVIYGEGKITGRQDDLFVIMVDGARYTSKRLMIATGSRPVIPDIEGIKEGLQSGFILTNREILDIAEIPKRLVLLGGGVIGLEMASYFNSCGCKVTVIEMLDHIAGNTDREIGRILQKNYSKKGVEFILSAKAVSVKNGSIIYEKDGMRRSVESDKVLLSVGRKPRIDHIGLETIGVLCEHGRIVTNEHMGTNIPGVYAAGDVNGLSMLAHAAYRGAEVAVSHMAGKDDRIRYNTIPGVIYTNPEVACVGETEESAMEKGFAVRTATVPMKYSGRYFAEVEGGDGICKVVADGRYNRLLGVHLIGSYASEMIFGAALMIETELRIEDIRELVFPHPTVCEVIREALFELQL